MCLCVHVKGYQCVCAYGYLFCVCAFMVIYLYCNAYMKVMYQVDRNIFPSFFITAYIVRATFENVYQVIKF